MKLIIPILLSLFLISCASDGQKSESASEKSSTSSKKAMKNSEKSSQGGYSCSIGKDVRNIEIMADGKGCKVTYTKFGTSSEPARAKSGIEYCNKKALQIKNNLENAGFKCS